MPAGSLLKVAVADRSRSTGKILTMNKRIVIEQLKEELQKRRRNWKAINVKDKIRFVNMDHQLEYDALQRALDVLQELPEEKFVRHYISEGPTLFE